MPFVILCLHVWVRTAREEPVPEEGEVRELKLTSMSTAAIRAAIERRLKERP